MGTPDSRSLHVLLASTSQDYAEQIEDNILVALRTEQHVVLRQIVYNGQNRWWFITDNGTRTRRWSTNSTLEAASFCSWADLLILAPIDADSLARMLHGLTDNIVLEIVRSWDVSKKMMLIPAMSTNMWENPMTKKQLSKLRRKWNWVRVLQPQLWSFEQEGKKVHPWEGMTELLEGVRSQIDLIQIGRDIDTTTTRLSNLTASAPSRRDGHKLPPEIWSIILEYTEDWELAKKLNVYTTLPIPADWRQHTSTQGPITFMEKLEWAVLTGTVADVKALFERHVPPQFYFSRLCIKILMRFALTPILTYLETSHKELFWSTFGHAFLPDKASSVFGRTEILEYWRTSPTFLTKEYTVEAIDGASRSGFVHILEWWHASGLPLKYTEAALEQASAKGHIDVLEWWKRASLESSSDEDADSPQTRPPLSLKPGKSITYATQSGCLPTLRWWAHSSIPFSHEESVAKVASTHGFVSILDFWHAIRGQNIPFDHQVLVGATKMGHKDVLDWWKNSGLRVEYKTCDIEEALEDGRSGERGESVRRWWAKNGLNLGVGTSEWMRTKVL